MNLNALLLIGVAFCLIASAVFLPDEAFAIDFRQMLPILFTALVIIVGAVLGGYCAYRRVISRVCKILEAEDHSAAPRKT